MPATDAPQLVHYLPLATTVISAVFGLLILRRYVVRRSGAHLLWWGIGILVYGLGTALEGSVTLFGNSVALTKTWYIAGALLGGYPLAQGTVFLLLRRRTALVLTAVTFPVIVALSVLVMLSPVVEGAMQAHRPSGSIIAWQWIRWFTPLVNGYAVIFLIGGAILSAVRYARHSGAEGGAGGRALGNALIAFGALLPGIGGSMAKAGVVEWLYVGEFVGVLFIWAGYRACLAVPRPAREAPTLAPREEPVLASEPA